MIPSPQQRVGSPPSGQKVRQTWTPAEDQLLARAVQIETPITGSISWCSVAAHLPGRNNKDCRKRWHYSIAHGHTIRKGTWTREEDQRLRDAVVIHGTRWSKIAQAVGTRNGDQCWKRWYDCLDPQIDKSPWTPEEDEKLLRMVTKHGRNWTGIVNEHFPKRTSLSAKNRYSILQRKQESRSSPQAAFPSRSPGQSYNHTRNISSESGVSITTTSTDNGLYDMTPAVTEPDYQANQQNPQITHSYWSLTTSASNPSIHVPSGPSTPDSTQADLVNWSAWGGMSNTNTPDPSSSISVSYGMDTTTSSYLSPSPTVLSMHSPVPDYNMMGSSGGFYQDNFMGVTTTTSTPLTSSYSPAMYTATTDLNSQYVVPYKTW